MKVLSQTNAARARCAAQHFGPWAIEPYWFLQAVAAVKAGTMQPIAGSDDGGDLADTSAGYETDGNGIAQIGIYGHMTKGQSKYGGTSTVRTRIKVRKAVRDDSVQAILLHIDSPGGTVAGTAELADDIARAGQQKTIYAYVEDFGASAAYWLASQTSRISANRTALIGSIGILAILDDTSGRYEEAGIKVHIVSTGPYKGAFVDGAPITEEHLDYAQEMIDDMNAHFLQAIKQGRQMSLSAVKKLADGRVHIAAKAKELGLIDAVESLDETVDRLRKVVRKQTSQTRATSQRLRMMTLKT